MPKWIKYGWPDFFQSVRIKSWNMAEESLNAFVMVTWVSLRSPEMGIVLECLTFSLAAGNDATGCGKLGVAYLEPIQKGGAHNQGRVVQGDQLGDRTSIVYIGHVMLCPVKINFKFVLTLQNGFEWYTKNMVSCYLLVVYIMWWKITISNRSIIYKWTNFLCKTTGGESQTKDLIRVWKMQICRAESWRSRFLRTGL